MIHGVLLINKKAGGTSHNIVSAVRGILGQKEVGHAGTLDPIAEGLIVILLGHGTKLSNYLLTKDKKYHFILRLGVTTDTLDKTGNVLTKKEVLASKEQIKQVLQKSQGQLSLPVPLVSAVKVKGKKLYEYKRADQTVSPPLRDMVFRDLEIKNIQKETAEVVFSCSKGSYVRSWVSFIGEELGTGACLESLTRLESFPFKLSSALTLHEVENQIKKELYEPDFDLLPTHLSRDNTDNNTDNNRAMKKKAKKKLPPLILEKLTEILGSAFIPFSQALPHIPMISTETREDEIKLKQGKISGNLKTRLIEQQKSVNKAQKNCTVRVMNHDNKKMLALLELRPFFSPKFLRVFLY